MDGMWFVPDPDAVRIPYIGATPDPERVTRYVDQVVAMIRADITAGRIPEDVATLGDVYDYVDGNVYVIDVLEDDYPSDPDAEVMFSDDHTDMSNAVLYELADRFPLPRG